MKKRTKKSDFQFTVPRKWIVKFLCKMGLHKNQIIYDNGKTSYKQCLFCGQKSVSQIPGGYQPINYDWLQD